MQKDCQTSPTVSIVMPVFNAEKHLANALESLLAQTYHNWQLIIVNDNSTDNSSQIIQSYANSCDKIKVITNDNNMGVAKSRNRAIEEASGDWIAFLDADDIWHPNKLFSQLALAEETDTKAIFSPYYIINEAGDVTGFVPSKPRILYQDMLAYNPIGNLTGMYNCKILGKVLQKPVKHEDYLMWLEVVQRAGVAFSTKEALAFYRKTSSSLSAKKSEAARWQWSIYRDELKFGVLRSTWSFLGYIRHNLTKIKPIKQKRPYGHYITLSDDTTQRPDTHIDPDSK